MEDRKDRIEDLLIYIFLGAESRVSTNFSLAHETMSDRTRPLSLESILAARSSHAEGWYVDQAPHRINFGM